MSAELNQAQAEAAGIVEGPVLVIAGAGTGKTRTLIHRLVSLVNKGVSPQSILLLTFTRRAAQEMIRRTAELLGSSANRIEGGTFHSTANSMLRRYGAVLDLRPNFVVLDQGDSIEIIGNLRSELNKKQRDGLPRADMICRIIGKSRNRLVSIGDVVQQEFFQFDEVSGVIEKVAGDYAGYKTSRQLLDFDDLLIYFLRLLENERVQQRISERYRFIMVDEYQDTNILQARLTDLLAGRSRNVMVVGDDAQSIYAFRGAYPKNLLEFHQHYPNVRKVTLEQNYRSSQAILNISNSLLSQMSQAFRKRLFTTRTGGDKPRLVEAHNDEEQARFIVHQVKQLQDRGTPLPEIAVLFRASFHSFALELELNRNQIAYVKYGGFKFTETAHIKDVLAHLRVLHNADDDLSFVRILKMHQGIGAVRARRICEQIAGQGEVGAALKEAAKDADGRLDIVPLANLMTAMAPLVKNPGECLRLAVEYYAPVLQRNFDDWPKRQRDLDQLLAMCHSYRSLDSLLSDLAIAPPNTSHDHNLVDDDAGGKLILSTMHSAKGLEWQAVFVLNLHDGAIPMIHEHQVLEDAQMDERIDEELRLFYVAATRAKDELYLIVPKIIQRNYGPTIVAPSRFVQNMSPDLYQYVRAADVLPPDERASRSGRRRPRRYQF
ncbi:MAG: ATP-dependent helicase [Lentisphaeria bacterium]|jgi:DNA helicase-2/ATP-dependent DNA helicase PcrA|nr:ATP-dependent helicase [Lentisphaeria bacterium]